jgi:hypothetical protein
LRERRIITDLAKASGWTVDTDKPSRFGDVITFYVGPYRALAEERGRRVLLFFEGQTAFDVTKESRDNDATTRILLGRREYVCLCLVPPESLEALRVADIRPIMKAVRAGEIEELREAIRTACGPPVN